MKKLLFVIPCLGGGGAERVLIDLINTLNRDYQSKYSITLFTIGSGVLDEQVDPNIKHIKIINTDLNSHAILSRIKVKLITGLLMRLSPKIMRKILVSFLNQTFDIEIAFLEGFPIKFVSQSFSKKIGWIHTNLSKFNYYSSKGYFRNKLEEVTVYSNIDKTVFVSKICKEGYLDYFELPLKQNLYDIKNIIDIDRIKKLSADDIKLDFKYICSVGRLSDEKGFDRLIKAYHELKEENKIKELKLLIVGSGKQEDELKKLTNSLNIENEVVFIPFDKNPYKYIKNSEFFVSSSRVEGYPTVVQEALTLEKPVVATNTGAAIILNDGEFGLVVQNSSDGIKEGIQELINNYIHYVNKASFGKKRIFENNQKRVKEIIDLLEQ